jgi:SAM-dependent methyltransferase
MAFDRSRIGEQADDLPDLRDLADFTSQTSDVCLRRLQAYDPMKLADAWRRASPRTPEEMRRFYATTDLYLWDLTVWHRSPGYRTVEDATAALVERFPPTQFRTALDYGSGIGTTAIRLAEAGYAVTLADVPGVSMEYAKFRLRRRGIPFGTVEITSDEPALDGDFDVMTCFDVLEHIPRPDRVLWRMTRHLRPGGGMAMVAAFFTDQSHPQHLDENTRLMRDDWPMVVSAGGLRMLQPNLFVKLGAPQTLLRKVYYRLWRWTRTRSRR